VKYSLLSVFLNARNVKLADIHCQICEVYSETAMCDGLERKWVRKFNEGHDNMHNEPRSSQPSVVSDDLMRMVEAKVHEDRQFTISLQSLHFQQISRSVLYKIVTDCLDFRKLCSRWVPKMLSEEHKKKQVASALTFLM
jgi:oligoribonuclease (3'-5' exoribonuclease)